MVVELSKLRIANSWKTIVPFSQKLKASFSWQVKTILDENTLSRLQSKVRPNISLKSNTPNISIDDSNEELLTQKTPIIDSIQTWVIAIEPEISTQKIQQTTTCEKTLDILEPQPKLLSEEDQNLDLLHKNNYSEFIKLIIKDYYNFPQLSAYHWDLFAKNWNKNNKIQLPTHIATLKNKMWVEDIHEFFKIELEIKLWMIDYEKIINLYSEWIIGISSINKLTYNKFILKWNRENMNCFWMQFPQTFKDFLKILWVSQDTLTKAQLEELIANLLQWKK